MPTDRTIEQFIGDSFSSVWDLELLAVVIEAGESGMTATELERQVRGSQLLVEQGIKALSVAGLVSFFEADRVRFAPVNAEVAQCARDAIDFYRRFPGRVRRLILAQQAPGLSAFADAFRLRREEK